MNASPSTRSPVVAVGTVVVAVLSFALTGCAASELVPICSHVNQTDCVDSNGIHIGTLKFNESETSNFSIILGTGFLLLLLLLWFQYYYNEHALIRAPFPDSTMDQLEERTCKKFIRLVMIHHPIAMLIYAGKRDGFNRTRRLFCIFVALSIQLTVTFVVLLVPEMPGYGAALIATAASFIYEKPIVRLVQYTGRHQCCADICSCIAQCLSYCCVLFCLIQIPLVFLLFILLHFGPEAESVVRRFSTTELLLAWAASVLLGYLFVIPRLGVLFCCCPAKYTESINEYSRTYEGFAHVAKGKTQVHHTGNPIHVITVAPGQHMAGTPHILLSSPPPPPAPASQPYHPATSGFTVVNVAHHPNGSASTTHDRQPSTSGVVHVAPRTVGHTSNASLSVPASGGGSAGVAVHNPAAASILGGMHNRLPSSTPPPPPPASSHHHHHSSVSMASVVPTGNMPPPLF